MLSAVCTCKSYPSCEVCVTSSTVDGLKCYVCCTVASDAHVAATDFSLREPDRKTTMVRSHVGSLFSCQDDTFILLCVCVCDSHRLRLCVCVCVCFFNVHSRHRAI